MYGTQSFHYDHSSDLMCHWEQPVQQLFYIRKWPISFPLWVGRIGGRPRTHSIPLSYTTRLWSLLLGGERTWFPQKRQNPFFSSHHTTHSSVSGYIHFQFKSSVCLWMLTHSQKMCIVYWFMWDYRLEINVMFWNFFWTNHAFPFICIYETGDNWVCF